MRKYFGTDGIRCKVGEFPLTPDFALKLGFSAGKALAEQHPKATVLIGKDTRLSGDMFETALAAGLNYAGVDVLLAGILPTPGIAHLVIKHQFSAGIVVSASHNPFYDNGIKFFNEKGEKLDDTLESHIEALIDMPMTMPDNGSIGRTQYFVDGVAEYIDFCRASADNLDLSGLNIVLDCAHGATYEVAPTLFKRLGANIITIGTEPNGTNINDHVGSTAPATLIETVLAKKADCGIAFDGDGDRLLIVDHQGRPFDGDDILYLLAIAKKEKRVVGTIMSNLGFEQALKKAGIELLRSKVGDRYVLEMLNEENLTIGGENSGHILCLDQHSTGDGIIAALQALLFSQKLGKSFAEIRDEIPKTVQVMHNVRIEKGALWESDALKQEIAVVDTLLAGKGRILIRPSGTEPVVRIMVESSDQDECEIYVERLKKVLLENMVLA